MRVLKNLFGRTDTKIDAGEIAVDGELLPSLLNALSIVKTLNRNSNVNGDLMTYITNNVKDNEMLWFSTNANSDSGSLPSTHDKWRYACGLAINRSGDIYVLLFSRDGDSFAIKTSVSNKWKVFE